MTSPPKPARPKSAVHRQTIDRDLDMIEGLDFTEEVDLDEEDEGKLVFTRISGPEWLSISSSGQMNGNPTNEDVGINQFVIRVTDPGGLYSDALVNIEVSFKELNRAPFWSPTVIPSNVKETNSDDTSKLNQSKENSKSKNRRRRRR